LTIVVVKQSAEPALTSNRSWVNLGDLQWGAFASARPPVAHPLMWAEPVVIESVRLHDVVQLSEIEAEELVQALAFQAADP